MFFFNIKIYAKLDIKFGYIVPIIFILWVKKGFIIKRIKEKVIRGNIPETI
jgi:hypothetical protein